MTSGGTALGSTPPAVRRGKLGWPRLAGWIVAGLVLVLVGALVGFFVARSQLQSDSAELVAAQGKLALVEKALAESEERNWMYYRETEALTAQLAEALADGSASSSTTTLAPGQAHVYRGGVYLVGEDISPGTYDGVVSGDVGYWARLKGTDGIIGSIITNGLPRGPFVLTIVESDKAVELRGVEIKAR